MSSVEELERQVEVLSRVNKRLELEVNEIKKILLTDIQDMFIDWKRRQDVVEDGVDVCYV